MNNCKDCIFWDTLNKTVGSCNIIPWVDYSSRIAPNEIAFYAAACDETGLRAGVKTGPMFGCVRFSKK